MIDELRDMVVERLQLYEKKNQNKLPERIFMYRDGVSEVSILLDDCDLSMLTRLFLKGQFDQVIQQELPCVLEACEKISGSKKTKYRPTITVIVCGKRHHARFYPTTSQYADRNGNTRPGTVVDKGITTA